MKNILRIISFLLILSIPSCDFLKNDFFRKLSGRPTGEQVDSIAAEIHAARLEAMLRESALADSLAAVEELGGMGVKLSKISRFGVPVRTVPYRYNVMAGVFRNSATAQKLVATLSGKGYASYMIFFDADVRAVCLTGSDRLQDIAVRVADACQTGDCPVGAWVYVVE